MTRTPQRKILKYIRGQLKQFEALKRIFISTKLKGLIKQGVPCNYSEYILFYLQNSSQ